ncbi:MAG: cupin domain-containing protein [Candidatus Nanopelagicales bacterium]
MTSSSHHPTGTGTSVGPGLDLRVPAASTAASISVHEGTLAPGDAIRAHCHDGADQLLYILEGEVEVTVGDATFAARRGDFVSKPRGIEHGFANRGAVPARVLEITSDDSFERLSLAAAELSDPETLPALQAAHGVHPAQG